MFNFGRRCCNRRPQHDCGCKKPQHDCGCRKQDHCHKPNVPHWEPCCFNITIKEACKCKEFDGCNSYPQPFHDECKQTFEVCCICR